MKYLSMPCALVLAGATALIAQPTVYQNGVVDADSLAAVGLPNSSIAQGSLVSIFGTNLGPAKSPSLSFPLQTNLGGVSVKVTSGGMSLDAIPLFVSPGQINALIPSATPTGSASLAVTYNGTSGPASFQVVAHSFGINSVNQSGSGQGIIDDHNYNLYGPATAALAGDVAIIWGTGLGAVKSGNEAGGPLPGDRPDIPVEVYVGLQKAAINYRGRSGCCAGVDQVAFVVPPGVTGCNVPVAVKIGDVVSNFVTMPIATGSASAGKGSVAHAAASRICSDPGGPSSSDITKWEQAGTFTAGGVSLTRDTTTTPGLPPPFGTGQPTTTTTDSGGAYFAKYTFTQLGTNPFGINVLGTCTVFTFRGNAGGGGGVQATPLDAGPSISVKGPNGTKQLPKQSFGYGATLGGGSGPMPQPLYLDAGAYTATGPGGKDVGPFTANINIASPLTWTNEDSINNVNRAAGQLVTWTGGDPSSTVLISGSSLQLGTNPDGSDSVGAVFTCTAPDSAGQFNIPALVLLSLPPSSTNPAIPIPTGSMSLDTFQFAPLTATGIEFGAITSSVIVGKSVTYQ